MSGHTKRILYAVFTIAGECAALALAVLACYFSTPRNWLVFAIFAIFFVLLPLNVLIHELGHILFGAICGMKFVSVKFGRFTFFREGHKLKCGFSFLNNTAGECALFPKSPSHVRGRFLAATLGGALLNFSYAIVFALLYFFAPRHPALLFFEMFAPLSLMEGIAALIPIELPAGKTDGLVAAWLAKRNAEEEIVLRVLEVQSILYRGEFSAIPPALLFELPVVREDLPALHALLLLRMQYLLWQGEGEKAQKALCDLLANEDLSDEARGEAERYVSYFKGQFQKEESPLCGVRALEERLAGGSEK